MQPQSVLRTLERGCLAVIDRSIGLITLATFDFLRREITRTTCGNSAETHSILFASVSVAVVCEIGRSCIGICSGTFSTCQAYSAIAVDAC